jgi:uncharacterized protein YqgV (UPF0045/DUF77 family)
MKIAVEISLYPLNQQYEAPILDFIHRLNQHPGLKVHTNNMSTQIEGEYDLVMEALNKELKESMEKGGVTIGVLKILNHPINL